jgi:hypothetical protein
MFDSVPFDSDSIASLGDISIIVDCIPNAQDLDRLSCAFDDEPDETFFGSTGDFDDDFTSIALSHFITGS